MTLPVVLRPETEVDLLAARNWYELQRVGLGDDFIDAVDESLARISAVPELYAIVFKGIRRGKLRRFPYFTYYRVLANRIEVIGILHGSRDPGVWHKRA